MNITPAGQSRAGGKNFRMLELKNITKKYGDLSILNDISLQIEKGEIVSILGHPEVARQHFSI